MTGTVFADILRDARMLSGFSPQYAWVRAWEPARGIPLCAAAAEAALAAGQDGLLPAWLRALAQTVRGRYAIRASEFALAADEAARTLHWSDAAFPAAVHLSRDAQTFGAWSAAVYADLRAADADERVFLPWLRAICARYLQE